MNHNKLTKNADLVQRASHVIPGTMYGHMSVQRMMPDGYPQFFERAEGCRLWDVDGNTYIDLMCAYGPMILGYQHPKVEDAADAQRKKLNTATGPAPVMVELAERFVAMVRHAEWCIFAKNGTDATTLCVTIARAATERRKILVASGAYHGAAPWCTPISHGIVEEDRAHLIPYTYNDVASLEQAVTQAGDDLAGVVVSAFKHDAFADQELPTPEFAHTVRRLCDRHNAALILDEVRAGFRLSLDSSWSALGIEPDLSAWSKAIANGHPLAAVLGKDQFRSAASQVFTTGSFWYQAPAMAASLATLGLLHEHDAPAHLEKVGTQLRQGLAEQAHRHGISIRQTGPVQMPMLLFDDDPKAKKGFRFCQAALQNGVYIHPWHNWFLSTAHTESDIQQVLDATDKAFAEVAEKNDEC